MKNLIILLFPLFLLAQQENEFAGKPIKVVASFQFKTASFYDYQINSSKGKDSIYNKIIENNLPESILSKKYVEFLSKNSKEKKNEIVLFSRLSLSYNSEEFYMIKYVLRENGKNSVLYYDTYSKQNNQWKEINSSNNILKKAKIILQLKSNVFSQFEVIEPSPNYPIINKLKTEIRDGDGTINIEKWAKVIEQNKQEMSKYFD